MLDNLSDQFVYYNILLGKNSFKEGNLDTSEYYLIKSLEEHETAESLFYIGMISSQKGNLFDALNYFYKAIELEPEYSNPCNEIGVILLRCGREKEALFWLKRAVKSAYNDAPHIPLYNLATLYRLWNKPERSLQYIHRALKIEPRFEEAIRLRDELLA